TRGEFAALARAFGHVQRWAVLDAAWVVAFKVGPETLAGFTERLSDPQHRGVADHARRRVWWDGCARGQKPPRADFGHGCTQRAGLHSLLPRATPMWRRGGGRAACHGPHGRPAPR